MNEEMMKKMAEPVDPKYPDGLLEIAEMLTFLPENMRVFMMENFAKNISKI